MSVIALCLTLGMYTCPVVEYPNCPITQQESPFILDEVNQMCWLPAEHKANL